MSTEVKEEHMSGHSKWSTIKRQKGLADAKRGALFTRIGNQIAIAARGGTDPDMNSALAIAIEKAKAANMPMSNIDNINRTYPEVRNAFNKKGGNIAEPGAVSFQFARRGSIRVKATGDDAILTILDAGAIDAEENDGEIQVYTEPKELAKVRKAIEAANLPIIEAELTYVPNNTIEITDPIIAQKVENLMDALDELDDVVETHTNFDIADGVEL